jgi:hypothetical protein
MARRGRGKSAYKFTTSRKTALRKAQLISARKRKGRGRGKATAAVAAIGLTTAAGVAIYGIRARNGKPGNSNSAKNAVDPHNKEAVRKAGAISPPQIASHERAVLREVAADTRSFYEIPANGLGRNNGGPGAKHSGTAVRWGQDGAVDPSVRKKALDFGHDGDGTEVLRSTGMIEKSLPKKLLQGERIGTKKLVGEKTIKRALSQRDNAVGHLRGNGKDNISSAASLDMMIVQGDVFGRTQAERALDKLIAESDALAAELGLRSRKPRGKKKGKK